MKLRFTPGAEAQFFSALAYIHDDNPTAARAFRVRAEAVLKRLEVHPVSGRVIPEFPGVPYREVIVNPYRFFYRTEGRMIWVVAVWHGRQRVLKPPQTKRRCRR